MQGRRQILLTGASALIASACGRQVDKQIAVPWDTADSVNTVVDGNSIARGGHDGPASIGGVAGYLHRTTRPFLGQRFVNRAIGGQSTDDMILRGRTIERDFDSDRVNILIVQEGTNQNSTSDSPHENCDKLFRYVRERVRWADWYIVLVTAPPAYLGDDVSAQATDRYNQRLDDYNAELSSRWREVAHALIDSRDQRGPFATSRYPDYRRTTFFDTAVVDGLSNDEALLTEPATGRAPHCKIHFSTKATVALARVWAKTLLALPPRRGTGRDPRAAVPAGDEPLRGPGLRR